MDIQWYPGHMTKARRMMEENLKLIDLIVELIDARVPDSSRNPDIHKMGNGKERLILLNKSDLADEQKTQVWESFYRNCGYHTGKINSKAPAQAKALEKVMLSVCSKKIERDRKRGIKNRPVRVMIAGIPNVGKSTLINSMTGRSSTKTGNRPGVTRGKQWIKLNKNIELLDTPGILWPKFDDQTAGLHLAMIGSMKDELLHPDEICFHLIEFLKERYPDTLTRVYHIDEAQDSFVVMEDIALRQGCQKKGGKTDVLRAAGLVLDDFRSGKLGKITLELPEDKGGK